MFNNKNAFSLRNEEFSGTKILIISETFLRRSLTLSHLSIKKCKETKSFYKLYFHISKAFYLNLKSKED